MRGLWAIAWLLAALPVFAAPPPGPGPYPNAECLRCHAAREPQLVAQWRASVHAQKTPVADCVACHGHRHDDAAARARHDDTCIGCHGGSHAPAVHSYASSKHGILVRLEGAQWDWNRPLSAANYRAPGCAYCHLHSGEHDVGHGVTSWYPYREAASTRDTVARDAMQAVCGDCHAPRYVAELAANGARQLEIGRMKLREAQAAFDTARDNLLPAELTTVQNQLATMRDVHLRNVRLGGGHQSPDYQWWLGQPALDGDLLHIKGQLGGAQRLRAQRDAAQRQ
jgi:hypothetical protein